MSQGVGGFGVLVERLEGLERENRRLKRSGFAAATVISAVVLLGQAAPKSGTIDAREVILRDDDGKARMTLRVTKHGPMIGLFDGNEQPRAGLGAFDHLPANLTLYDASGRPRIALGSGSPQRNAEPGILILNADGREIFSKP